MRAERLPDRAARQDHLCPQLYARQIAAGAWAITVANASQALVCLRFGVKRVLIANQLVGPANIRSLAEALNQDPEVEFFCLADSAAGVDYLARGWEQYGAQRPIGILLEFGHRGWRTGVRSAEAAKDVHRAILSHRKHLCFRGVEAFEGHAQIDQEADEFLAFLAGAAAPFAGQGERLLFSAGGSAFLGPVSRVLRRAGDAWQPVIRSGCYVTHDHGEYAERQEHRAGTPEDAELPRFRQALELWSYVQSMPDPGLAILTFGKRDCSYDLGLPKPLDIPAAEITHLNDQHAFLKYSGDAGLAIGDRVRCGISHPCTAFDKWRVMPVVDDDYNVIDLYRTYF